jgi:hypothetical protein
MLKTRMRDVAVLLPGITGSMLQWNGVDTWAISGRGIANALFTLGNSLQKLKLIGDNPDVDDLGDGIRATRLMPDAHLVPGLVKIDGYSWVTRLITERFQVVLGAPKGTGQLITLRGNRTGDFLASNAPQSVLMAVTWM